MKPSGADMIGNALLTAAHEQCVAMMLARESESGSKRAGREKTKFAAHLTLDNISVQGWAITQSHLVFAGNAPEIRAADELGEPVAAAKTNAPIPLAPDIQVTLGNLFAD